MHVQGLDRLIRLIEQGHWLVAGGNKKSLERKSQSLFIKCRADRKIIKLS
jgi:hypothetical protein